MAAKPKQNLNKGSLEPFRLKALERIKTQQSQKYLICTKNPNKQTPPKNLQNPQTTQQKNPKDTNMAYELAQAINSMEELTRFSNNNQD